MHISQKGHYAVRAIFALAKEYGNGTIKAAKIAENQIIPIRFLEVILNELKHGGFVESKRGSEGGFLLSTPPSELTVGQVLRFMEGPFEPIECRIKGQECTLYHKCVFVPIWKQAREAVETVYDGVTFQELVDQAEKQEGTQVSSYSI